MSSSSRRIDAPSRVDISSLLSTVTPIIGKVHKHVAQLVEAAAPEMQQGSLSARNRLAATGALESLVNLAITDAHSEAGAYAVALIMGVLPNALSALVQMHAIALRAVSEAGGAARAAAAASSRSASGRLETEYNTDTPKASSAGAWVEALRFSSNLLALLFASFKLQSCRFNAKEKSITPYGDSGETGDEPGSNGCILASALLRCDALSALSRLLAAEEHRGNAAVLDTDTIARSFWPLSRLLEFSCMCPWNSTRLQGPGAAAQQQQLAPAVLRALAASGVAEHVCRFAVTRLAGQQAGGGRGALSAEETSRHWREVLGLQRSVAFLAHTAARQGKVSTLDASAVRLAPFSQVSKR